MAGRLPSCFRRGVQTGAGTSPRDREPSAEQATEEVAPRRRERRQRTVTLDPNVIQIAAEAAERSAEIETRPSSRSVSSAQSSAASTPQSFAGSSPRESLGTAGSNPGSPVSATSSRRFRRRGRRCATWANPMAAFRRARAQEEQEEEDPEEQPIIRRRTSRSSTAPAAVLRKPLMWADPNACKALTELVLDDRRRGLNGEGDAEGGETFAPSKVPALVANLIAPFLRFDEPLPHMLYVFGGRNQKSPALDSVEMFDHWHGQWVQCPPLPGPRVSATAAVLPDGRMLIVGGYDGRGMVEGLLASCELYDPRAREWKVGGAAKMARSRWGHGTAALGGKVYVTGGCSLMRHAEPAVANMETLRDCEVYCPETDRWSSIAPLSTARSGARAVAVADRYVAVIGGCDDIFGREEHLRTVELFDPESGAWTMLARQLAQPRPIAAAAALPTEALPDAQDEHALDRVLVMGGAAALSSTEVFEVTPPEKERRRAAEPQGKATRQVGPYSAGLPDMPQRRMGCQAAVISLPKEGGPSYPKADRPSVVVIGGELWETGHHGPPKRADFSSIPVFDIVSGTWRKDEVMPPMPTARTAVALCVGLGQAWQPQAF